MYISYISYVLAAAAYAAAYAYGRWQMADGSWQLARWCMMSVAA
jgi:hypothetical protein